MHLDTSPPAVMDMPTIFQKQNISGFLFGKVLHQGFVKSCIKNQNVVLKVSTCTVSVPN